MPVTLRDALPADEVLLFELYASSRAHEMALVPWSEEQINAFLKMQYEAQTTHYRQAFPDATFSVILRDGAPVGRLYVRRGENEIRILDITILPDVRNQGIGNAVLSDLVREAAQSKKNVLIYIETFNPSLRLFGRLGFKSIGEEGFNYLMEWRDHNEALDAGAKISAQ
jgi:ribosomal protein S18 acetylase RimI-like enzyme